MDYRLLQGPRQDDARCASCQSTSYLIKIQDTSSRGTQNPQESPPANLSISWESESSELLCVASAPSNLFLVHFQRVSVLHLKLNIINVSSLC